jgi:hypothetical protein
VSDRQPGQALVTVAVVSWNTQALLQICLDSFHDDAAAGLIDVWVVDNASSDGSVALVRELYPWVQLIASEENLGFGRAVNAVAAQTSTAWVAPANADVQVSPDAIRSLLSYGERHPEAAVIAPRLVLPDGTTQQSTLPFPTISLALAHASGATRLSGRLARHWQLDQGFDPERPAEISWAVGAFLLVRRTAWSAVGGFDEEQWMYAEDLDLGWRLRQAGWTARYAPDAVVFHNESSATQHAWGEERHERRHASTYDWIERRRGIVIARATAVTNVAGYLFRAAVHAAFALFGRRSSNQGRTDALRAMRLHKLGLRRRSILEHLR